METLRIKPETQNKMYYSPFSVERDALRVDWNVSGREIDWDLYLLGAEIKEMTLIFDNGGKTLDRYTIVLNREEKNGNLYQCLGADTNGVGFFQHSECIIGEHLGNRISFLELSTELQLKLKDYFEL